MQAFGRGPEANARKLAFAKRCGTSVEYLGQIAYGFRVSSPGMAAMIERASHGCVTCEELNPNFNWALFGDRGRAART